MPYAYFGLIVSREPLTTEEGKTLIILKTPKGEDIAMPIAEVGPGNFASICIKLFSLISRTFSAASGGAKLR